MSKARVDLIMHPIRMRIILALVDQALTPQQIGERLEDVPQATLYRHLGKLAKARVLEVVEERPVRGTVEKVYTLNNTNASFSPAELASASKDDLMRYFTSFAIGLLADFARYLQLSEKPDLLADMVHFRQVPLHVTPQELTQLLVDIQPALTRAFLNPPAPGRKRMVFSTVLIPTDLETPAGQDEDLPPPGQEKTA